MTATVGEHIAGGTTVGERRTADELRVLARYASVDLAGATAQQIVRWAWDVFGDRVVASQSMANNALAHIIDEVAPRIPVIFLDTGFHFPETLQTRDRLQERTSLMVLSISAAVPPELQDRTHGPELWRTNPDQCCRLRKVQPMEEVLRGFDVWITGMRNADSAFRKENRKVVEFDESRGVLKLAPLLHWSDEQLLRYTIEHDVTVNPLMYDGYPSIGCAPCTRRVAPGEDSRAGRWSGSGKTECGLHP